MGSAGRWARRAAPSAVLVLLLLEQCTQLRAQQLPSAQTFNVSQEPILTVPLGRLQIDEKEWRKLLQENLEVDMAYWKGRAPLRSEDIMAVYGKLLKEMYIPAVLQVVLIYNNRIYWPMRTDINGTEAPEPASFYNRHFQSRVSAALATGRIQLPNCIFIYNTDDNAPRFNSPQRGHPIPLISLAKALGKYGGDDLDILVPQMFTIPNSLFLFPWHLKKDMAYFRGIAFCSWDWKLRYHASDACPRLYLSYLAERDRQAGNATVLDVGIVEPYQISQMEDASVKLELPVLPRAPIAHHSYYKWLVQLEGITASYRLSQLFFTNSVILYQRSHYIEYFYRSMRPWVHYVPFWNDTNGAGMDDIYAVIAQLRRLDATAPHELQRIATASQEFALRFCTPYARLQYYREALTAYKSLFPDMDAYVMRTVQEMRAKGWNIP